MVVIIILWVIFPFEPSGKDTVSTEDNEDFANAVPDRVKSRGRVVLHDRNAANGEFSAPDDVDVSGRT